ncbi:MAG: hypothetical protein MZV64_09690 [Ignavibacteriales bacterium]|nr:hypothetical protein [Ignavibacteriales bacterium]
MGLVQDLVDQQVRTILEMRGHLRPDLEEDILYVWRGRLDGVEGVIVQN